MKRNLSEGVTRKFIESYDVDDWEIETDSGWSSISHIHKTIEYQEWEIKTISGYSMICADTHIVFDQDYNQVFVKDLIPNISKIITKSGEDLVISVEKLETSSNMYDITVESDEHRFWSNDILSHNTTTTAGYLLWSVLFQENYSVAILANKGSLAREILDRIKYAYECLPKFLQQGIIQWNRGNIELENKSKIIAYATSASGVRGGSFNCVEGDTKITILDEYGRIFIDKIKNAMDSNYSFNHFFSVTKCIGWVTVNKITNKKYSGYHYTNNVDDGFIGEGIDLKCDIEKYGIENFELSIINIFNTEYNDVELEKKYDCLQVLTHKGFRKYQGLIENFNKDEKLSITFSDNTNIICTKEHRFFIENDFESAENLKINDEIYGGFTVTDIDIIKKDCNVYDLLEVEETHSYYTNNKVSHNCVALDEFAHVQNSVAEDFFRSTYPVISSGTSTKIIIISCVVKDTYIFSTDGIKQVSDFIDYNVSPNPVLGYETPFYHIKGFSGINTGNVMVNSGKSKTRIIKSGSSFIECSLNHKLWACKNGKYDWYMSKELTTDDYISIKYGEHIWGNKEEINGVLINNRTAYSIGRHITGDSIRISDKLTNVLSRGIISKQLLECSGKIINYILSGIFNNICSFIDGKILINHPSKEFLFQLRIILMNFGILTEYSNNSLTVQEKFYSDFYDYFILNLFNEYNNLNYDVLYEKIKSIEESENEVYDFSLDHVKDDFWCHSVLYNGIVGHQTPKGLNLFYKMWTDAVEGRSSYKPFEISWDMVPGRDQKWKEEFIKNSSEEDWQQEIECVSGDSLVCIQDETGNEYNITIEELHRHLSPNNYKIKTPNGFESFNGTRKTTKDFYFHIEFENNTSLKCSDDHKLLTTDGFISAKNLDYSHIICSEYGQIKISNISIVNEQIDLFDIVNSGIDHCYYSNNIVSHNCEFIGSSATLVSGSKLRELAFKNPILSEDNLDIYEQPIKGHTYICTVDCSEGVGQDYSTVNVMDVSQIPYKQVAKYRDNKIPLLFFPNTIYSIASKYNEAFVLVETNNIGQQVVDILHYDLEYENIFKLEIHNIKGQMISGGFKRSATIGIKTTKSVKKIGCANLKTLIETNKLIINDFDTISELTTFVRNRDSYAADDGSNDDLVMGLVLFGWLTAQSYFKDSVNIDIRKILLEEQNIFIEETITPVGFIDNGLEKESINDGRDIWYIT